MKIVKHDVYFWSGCAEKIEDLRRAVTEYSGNSDVIFPGMSRGGIRFATWFDGSRESLRDRYEAWSALAPEAAAERPRIVYMYSGQGSQFEGMGEALWRAWPWFRSDLLDLFAGSQCSAEANLADIMLGRPGAQKRLMQTQYTQPIMFAFAVALTRVWTRWGLKADAVMGHSLGEFPAAWASGAVSAQDGMRLVTERGRIMQTVEVEGKYVCVKGELSDVILAVMPYSKTVSVAGANAPSITTVSGPSHDVDQVVKTCVDMGMSVRELPVSLPFHSPMMQPIVREFVRYCESFTFEPTATKWISTLTGRTIGEETPLNADYWGQQILETVRFWAGMENVVGDQTAAFLEIGPGKSLIGMGREAVEYPDEHIWLSSLDRKLGDRESLFHSAAMLWQLGADIDLEKAHADCFSPEIAE